LEAVQRVPHVFTFLVFSDNARYRLMYCCENCSSSPRK
jgi:hypothetical protein